MIEKKMKWYAFQLDLFDCSTQSKLFNTNKTVGTMIVIAQ